MSENVFIAIISVVSVLLGTISGALLTSILERNNKREELLFEARRLAFSKFIGIARNLILTSGYSETDERYFSNISSEVLMLLETEKQKDVRQLCNQLHDAKNKQRLILGMLKKSEQNILITIMKKVEKIFKEQLSI